MNLEAIVIGFGGIIGGIFIFIFMVLKLIQEAREIEVLKIDRSELKDHILEELDKKERAEEVIRDLQNNIEGLEKNEATARLELALQRLRK
jgi:hypothetical protein